MYLLRHIVQSTIFCLIIPWQLALSSCKASASRSEFIYHCISTKQNDIGSKPVESDYTVDDAKKVLDTLNNALFDRNGELALWLVSDATISYYDRVRQLAYQSNYNDISQLPIFQRYFCMLFLHAIPRSILGSTVGVNFFRYIVYRGFLATPPKYHLRIIHFSKVSDREYLAETASGRISDIISRVYFVVERWYLTMDLSSYFRELEHSQGQPYDDISKERGMSVTELLIEMVEKQTRRTMDVKLRKKLLGSISEHHREN